NELVPRIDQRRTQQVGPQAAGVRITAKRIGTGPKTSGLGQEAEERPCQRWLEASAANRNALVPAHTGRVSIVSPGSIVKRDRLQSRLGFTALGSGEGRSTPPARLVGRVPE